MYTTGNTLVDLLVILFLLFGVIFFVKAIL